ncbi:hypothetical protein DH2020_049110 [Rehmannia glutinosa]|uniref:Uncharacterized protein n=1 Tax=Rehmannia glutinosa TaxID=99300 RepID=A0ABR0U4C7_REHGL
MLRNLAFLLLRGNFIYFFDDTETHFVGDQWSTLPGWIHSPSPDRIRGSKTHFQTSLDTSSRTTSHSDPAHSSFSGSSSSSKDVTDPLQAVPINIVPSNREAEGASPSRSGSSDTHTDLPLQDSWELIKSRVCPGEASQISHRYFIPPEYKVVIPERDDRMHSPPPNCLSLHLATLDAGLRFPLNKDLEDIFIRLGLCLTQFAPSAIRQILGFIVLMKHFKVAPSAAHFWSLFSITTSTRTNDRGFFYLTYRPHCKFLAHLPSSSDHWKERFIFIKAPPDRPWRISRAWRFSKPRVHFSDLGECSWAENFISEKLTTYLYDIRELLKEEVLSVVGLSPTVVPRTQSLGMAVKASLVAKVIREQKEKLIAAARSSVSVDEVQAIEPSHEVKFSSHEPLVLESHAPILTIETGGSSDPNGKEKSKSKKKDKDRSQSGSKSKDSGGGKTKKKARIEKAKPSDKEVSIAIREIEDRQKKLALAREQDHIEASRPPRPFSGTRVIPKWDISPESSILKTRVGEDSLELYLGCILPQDQFALSVMPDTKLEDIAAHDLMRNLEKEKSTIETRVWAEYDTRLKQVETKLVELAACAKCYEESLQASEAKWCKKRSSSRSWGSSNANLKPTNSAGSRRTLTRASSTLNWTEEEGKNLEGHEFSFILQDPDLPAEETPPPGDQVHEDGDDLLDVASLLGPTS